MSSFELSKKIAVGVSIASLGNLATAGEVLAQPAAAPPETLLTAAKDQREQRTNMRIIRLVRQALSFLEVETHEHIQPRPERYWYGPGYELQVLKELGTTANAELAFNLAKKHHWFSDTQVGCADEVWFEESKFEKHADNPASDAYGIPQANPGYKMAAAGSDWQNNATTQINWGYNYMSDRYGTPCGALQYHNANGNY